MFATSARAQRSKVKTWPSPTRGWFEMGNLGAGQDDAAERLDNIFPTSNGARVRYGSTKHATLDASPRRFVRYTVASGSKLFASTDADLFEISAPADADVTPTASMTALTGGEWVSVQFTTSGGAYVVAVNGTDNAFYYDGTNVEPLVDEATNNLSYDALTGAFTVGQTVTGGTSGATAEIHGVMPSSATAGTLKLGAITGTFQDDEALTDPITGAATADGTSSSASAITITNVDTSALSVLWMFKERLFFVEKDTLSAWYLPVDSIGGAAVEFPMGSVFKRGGSLLFGATWSLDSGSGLDDKCVFVTTEGELAVYEGTDPASASTWGLVGVYEIGTPVDKFAAVRTGGDLIVITDDGMVPVSQAVVKDRAALIYNAITAPIEDAWRSAVAGRTAGNPITATLWQSQSMLLVGTGNKFDGLDVSFVINANTGAWARYLGWDVRASVVFDDNLYFASDSGVIYQGEVGGTDDGTAYTAYWVPKYSDFGTTAQKFANHVSLISRSAVSFDFGAKVFANYEFGTMSAPSPIAEPDSSSEWGSGSWGTSSWGATGILVGQEKWKARGNRGHSLSPGVAVTVNQTPSPKVEFVAVKLIYEVGAEL